MHIPECPVLAGEEYQNGRFIPQIVSPGLPRLISPAPMAIKVSRSYTGIMGLSITEQICSIKILGVGVLSLLTEAYPKQIQRASFHSGNDLHFSACIKMPG